MRSWARRAAVIFSLLSLGLVGLAPPGGHAVGTAAAAPYGLEGVPALKHVFIIVLENEDYATSWGPASPATYLNSLKAQGAFAQSYYGVSHLSADNYIAMTSGQAPTPVFQSDCTVYATCYASEKARLHNGRNIGDQIEEQGLTWKGYMQSMQVPCQHPALTNPNDSTNTSYATKHDPFVYYPTIVDNQARCDSHVVPFTGFGNDLATAATTPNYSFITPDMCEDGHDAPCKDGSGRPGGLAQADAFLRATVPAILASPAYADGGALFITFDEASNTDNSGCCASGIESLGLEGGGHVGLLMLSPLATPGKVSVTPYDHHSLLRTVEDGFGISQHLNNAGSPKEHAMADLFTP
jgi:hypothetical protein